MLEIGDSEHTLDKAILAIGGDSGRVNTLSEVEHSVFGGINIIGGFRKGEFASSVVAGVGR